VVPCCEDDYLVGRDLIFCLACDVRLRWSSGEKGQEATNKNGMFLFLGETKKKMNLVHHDKSPLLCDQQELLWHINDLLLAPTEEQGSQQSNC
jgi:hypothetical protein